MTLLQAHLSAKHSVARKAGDRRAEGAQNVVQGWRNLVDTYPKQEAAHCKAELVLGGCICMTNR
jgi:hypothetical protein